MLRVIICKLPYVTFLIFTILSSCKNGHVSQYSGVADDRTKLILYKDGTADFIYFQDYHTTSTFGGVMTGSTEKKLDDPIKKVESLKWVEFEKDLGFKEDLVIVFQSVLIDVEEFSENVKNNLKSGENAFDTEDYKEVKYFFIRKGDRLMTIDGTFIMEKD